MASGTLTDNGSTDWVPLENGEALLIVSGTFGGGTATLELLAADGLTAVPLAEGAFDEATAMALEMPGSRSVRFTLAGASAPSLAWEISPKRLRRLN
jgi:hypothetical protein